MERAIPKFIDPESRVKINGECDSQETDMVFLDTPISQTIASFTRISPRISLEPMITILSSVYPIIQKDSFGSTFYIFDKMIWRSGTKDEIQLIRLGLNITPEDTLSNAPRLFASQRLLKEKIVTNKTHKSGTKDEIQLIRLGLNITPDDILSNAPKLFASQNVLKEKIVTNKTHSVQCIGDWDIWEVGL
ncbi:unnamed protein product [Oppiella nova]|uniref:Uncharacterized protein n=1 Tax=Oppiella nova TaxID=334625 RepID=A0A7R9QJY7_9ACAR|nr:unnamed protein product [Oppiella nova]CAG2166795.1 unnamed protein product [Oppiella nova]